MSFFDTPFDANAIAPAAGSSPLPEGEYNVTITTIAEKKTQDGTGSYLDMTLTVTDGPYARRKLFGKITLTNKSEKARDYGRAQLSAFCRSTGIMVPKSVSDFVNQTARCKVGIERDLEDKPRNKVVDWIYGAEVKKPVVAAGPVAAKSSAAAALDAPF